MPKLDWIGKDKVISHHLDVPVKVLDHKYGFRPNSDDKSETGSGNMIIHGDNLEALKALLPRYEGKIDCIYIDPPYNTGNESWVYNDNVNDPHIQKWLGQVVGNEADDLSRHDKWLCMMYPRLTLMRQLLSKDGVIFIAIDDNEQAHLRLLCDEIFGRINFVAQFIWRGGKRNLAKYVSTSHEYMLCFAKDLTSISENNISWKEKKKGLQEIYKKADEFVNKSNGDYLLASKLLKAWFKSLPDENESKANAHYQWIDSNGVYFASDISRGGGGGPKWEIVNPLTGNIVQTPSRGWSYGKKEDLLRDIELGLIHFNGDGVPCKKRYLKENETQVFETVFYKDRRGSSKRLRELMGGDCFPFPKDEDILARFFKAFTQKDAIILDCFAGSGTTGHAVYNLNTEEKSNRHFILCEMCDYAENITAERIRRVMKGSEEGNNTTASTGGSFDFYELGEKVFAEDGNLNENISEDKIREYVYYSETRQPLTRIHSKDSFLLDTYNNTGIYFYYIPNKITTFGPDTLNIVTEKADSYVVYADRCTLSEDYMLKHNIVFKKIPRDIKKF